MVRPSLIRDYVPKGIVPTADDAWSWSMWRGYLNNEDGILVRKWFEEEEAAPPIFIPAATLLPAICDRSPTR